MVQDDYWDDIKIDFKCAKCNRQTAIPVLKVESDIKCKHCGAALPFDVYAFGMKSLLLSFAFKHHGIKAE